MEGFPHTKIALPPRPHRGDPSLTPPPSQSSDREGRAPRGHREERGEGGVTGKSRGSLQNLKRKFCIIARRILFVYFLLYSPLPVSSCISSSLPSSQFPPVFLPPVFSSISSSQFPPLFPPLISPPLKKPRQERESATSELGAGEAISDREKRARSGRSEFG